MLACQKDDARLVSIADQSEHLFIQSTLRQVDSGTVKHMWYTGGRKINGTLDASPAFEWVGLGPISQAAQFWTDLNSAKAATGDYIIYAYNDQDTHRDFPSWFWLRRDGTSSFPYICEVAKVDAGKILSSARDFTFGVVNVNPDYIPRGPHFVEQPDSVTYDASVASTVPIGSVTQAPSPDTAAVMECDAHGYPNPSYTWIRVAVSGGSTTTLSSSMSSRYVITNGRLSIYAPQSADSGQYYCVARNSLGTIRSSVASITFQQINEFPRDPQVYSAQAFNYFIMPCKHNNPPSTRLAFFWYVNRNPSQYIDTSIYPYIFISSNGNLYFSYVTTADNRIYNCQASLYGGIGEKRTSPTYTLQVSSDANPITVPVQIDSSFPQVFPTNPLIGDVARLECWARGTTIGRDTFNYQWSRDDLKGLPKNSSLSDYNRVLTIYNAQFEDQGVYRCTVLYNQVRDSKTVTLSLQSLPFFGQGGLLDTHADQGADFTWPCLADGKPTPTYSWLKNAQPFSPQTLSAADSQRILFSSDMSSVRFTSLDMTRDPGMYQCAATNVYGTTYSNAQLRVLAIAPRFTKHPTLGSVVATINGNATIPCDPEGAPQPTKQWRKGGSLINPPPQGDRLRLLPNGYLFIQAVSTVDAGNYSCTATNSIGSASAYTTLTVLESTRISYGPVQGTFPVNTTVRLACRADYNRYLDIVYLWEFNGKVIDFEDWRYKQIFRRDVRENRGGIVILSAGYDQQGYYRCIARTLSDEASMAATVTIVGPPGVTAGVTGSNAGQHSVFLQWISGAINGAPIFAYIIELYNVETQLWSTAFNASNPNDVGLMQTNVTGLFADTSYQFRVSAQNSYGVGMPSSPSSTIRTLPDKPTVYPDNVGGGGGKVGTLVITWDLLPREKWNGPNLAYSVQYRTMGSVNWATPPGGDRLPDSSLRGVGRYTMLTLASNYYTPYQARVKAMNSLGDGPWSPAVNIFSAEDAPSYSLKNTNAQPFNSTALIVYWEPVMYTRQDIRGQLLGFHVFYWPSNGLRSLALRAVIHGNATEGIVIGLDAFREYNIMVQLFNSAGDSATGRIIQQTTWKKAPQWFPEYIKIYRKSVTSMMVHWNGLQSSSDEEPLDGYKVRVWKTGQNIITSTFYEAGKNNYRAIDDLYTENGTMYNLRVFGYSRGGVGKMSSPMLQVTFGCGTSSAANPDANWVFLCGQASFTSCNYWFLAAVAAIANLLKRMSLW